MINLNEAFKILHCCKKDNLSYIKQIYKKLVRIYHPDNSESGDRIKYQELNKSWELIDSFKNKQK